MSTIRSSIQLQDRMTPALRSITTALNVTINSFEALQRASHNSVDTTSITTVRRELASAEVAINQVEQEIREANNAQQQFNGSVRSGGSAMDGLVGKVRNLASAYLGIRAAQTGMDAVDTNSNNKARLSLIVKETKVPSIDVEANIQTVGTVDTSSQDAINAKMQATEELQDRIFEASQRARANYDAMQKNVAKLGLLAGKSFSNTDEIIAFNELMQKAFKVSGADPTESANAMYQLTQAMASGRLQGDEFRSIIENAPMLANAISEYTGVGQEGLKQLSSDGAISADIIKNSLFSAAVDIESKYTQIPRTFGDIWTDITNTVKKQSEDLMDNVNSFINSDTATAMVDGIKYALIALMTVLSITLGIVQDVGSFFVDNWSWIVPIIWGIVGALVVYNATMGIGWLTTLKSLGASAAHAVATMAQTAATIAFTLATRGLNAALAMCPVTWIIIAIIALIAVFYAAVAAVNKFAGTSYSATGIVVGAFLALGAHIINTFVIPVWNHIVAFINFFANVFNDPVAAVQVLFYDMCLNVIGYITNMAHAIEDVINKIPGVTVDITSGLDNFKGKLEDASAKVKSESEWKEVVGKMEYIDYGDAYKTGYGIGQGIEDKVSSVLDFKIPGLDDYTKNAPDYSNMMSGIGEGIGNTAENTARTADALDATEEDLKYLRDLAEAEVIDRTVFRDIKIDLGGITNNVNSNMDLDGIVDYIGTALEDAMLTSAEGVH